MLCQLWDGTQSGRVGGAADVGCLALSLARLAPVTRACLHVPRLYTPRSPRCSPPLPDQVVGGVTFPDAWGDTDHSHGAAFLDDATHAQGVVGCVMTGPFQVGKWEAGTLKRCNAQSHGIWHCSY